MQSLLVCTAEGQVVEHLLAPRLVPAVAPAAGLVPASAGYVSSLSAMVVGVVAPAPRPEPSKRPAPVDVTEGGVELELAAVRCWDVCRHSDWKTDKRPMPAQLAQISDVAATVQRSCSTLPNIHSAQTRHRLVLFESDSTSWGVEAMATTYVPPHRRIWMGPQFTFKACCRSIAPSSRRADMGARAGRRACCAHHGRARRRRAGAAGRP